MLNETTYERTKVGLIKKGFYYIRTTRAVWSRVQVVDRSRNYVRLFYTVVRRRRRKTRHLKRVEDLPIGTIIEARRYST